MKVGIIGSRNKRGLTIDKMKEHIPPHCTEIISGGAVGVDQLAEEYAKENGLSFTVLVPNYDFFGSSAPLVRNTAIVAQSELVVAFWDYESKGTAHAIKECIRLQIPVKIISLTEDL